MLELALATVVVVHKLLEFLEGEGAVGLDILNAFHDEPLSQSCICLAFSLTMHVVGGWFCSLPMTIKLSRIMSENRSPIKRSSICVSRCPTPPPSALPGLMEGMCAGHEGHQSASPQVVRRKRPMMRHFSGKRRESPLTAGGGARNISPCAADGRKRRGGALDAPGTLKTGYRGRRIGTRAGPPPARMPAEISDERPIP